MRSSLALVSMLASIACAADTINFMFPGGTEGVDPVATIKVANPSTTEFHLACPTGVDSNDCGWGPGLDYTILSKTHYQAQLTFSSYSMSFGCDSNTAKSEMTCVMSVGGQDVDLKGPVTTTFTGSDAALATATIVEGASLLKAAASASPQAASGTATAAAASTGIKVAPSGSASASASRTASGSAAAAQNTNAAGKFGVEASALLGLVGVAALAW